MRSDSGTSRWEEPPLGNEPIYWVRQPTLPEQPQPRGQTPCCPRERDRKTNLLIFAASDLGQVTCPQFPSFQHTNGSNLNVVKTGNSIREECHRFVFIPPSGTWHFSSGMTGGQAGSAGRAGKGSRNAALRGSSDRTAAGGGGRGLPPVTRHVLAAQIMSTNKLSSVWRQHG